MSNENKRDNLAENHKDESESSSNTEHSEAGLDNKPTMGSSTISELVGRPENREGIYRTAKSGDTAGSTSTVYEVEEREELEARGINPDWDIQQFRKKLAEEAKKNGVLLDESYLNDIK